MTEYISVNPEGCTGCRECEVICSLYRFGECNPELSAVRVVRNEGQGLAEPVPLVCQQCDDPACLAACPVEAITQDTGSGLIAVDGEICTGCGDCTDACPAGCVFPDADESSVIMCDLCQGDPQCVTMCHSGSLQISQADSEPEIKRVDMLVSLLEKSRAEAGIASGGAK